MWRKRIAILDGFTLVELLMVVIVIAVLVSIVVPNYIKTVEKVRAGEAITNLQIIRVAENMYNSENGNYTSSIAQVNINSQLNINIEPKDWSYTVAGSSSTTFEATATRNLKTIIIDQDGWGGGDSDFQPRN